MSFSRADRDDASPPGGQGTSPPGRQGVPVPAPTPHATGALLHANEPVSLLVVSAKLDWQATIRDAARTIGCTTAQSHSLRQAEEWLDGAGESLQVRLLVIDLPRTSAAAEKLAMAAREVGVATILACDEPGVNDAVMALRCGSFDLLHRGIDRDELSRRLLTAVERARVFARQAHRITRLKRICRRLSDARRQVARQVDSLWTDLLETHRELARTMNQATLSNEFGGLIRQELDLEVLLRTTLEYILGKSGPTNAAVFLPSTAGDFSLGAYVNYDCPKETVDILLDHMANVVAPRFEHVPDIAHLTDPREIEEQVTGDAMWIRESHIVAFACRHEGECLAIFLFFRDSKSAYTESFLNQIRVVRDLFAAQLARVVRIHHRHLPKEKWGALGDPPRDDSDDGMAM